MRHCSFYPLIMSELRRARGTDELGDKDVGGEGSRALETEAVRLTEWLGGVRVMPRFPSPLWRAAGA
jgi:hypothetical protein